MRLLAALLMLVALVDVVAEEMAESRLEERLSASIDGSERVEIELQGRPFLMQAVQGSFEGLEIRFGSLQRRGIEVVDVRLALRDLEFSVREVLEGTGRVQVGGGHGRGSITQRALNVALAREGVDATISLAGDSAAVSAAGVEAPVDAVAVRDGGLEFSSEPVGALRIALPDLLPTRDQVGYRSAQIQGARLVVLLELPATALDPASL